MQLFQWLTLKADNVLYLMGAYICVHVMYLEPAIIIRHLLASPFSWPLVKGMVCPKGMYNRSDMHHMQVILMLYCIRTVILYLYNFLNNFITYMQGSEVIKVQRTSTLLVSCLLCKELTGQESRIAAAYCYSVYSCRHSTTLYPVA